MKTLTTSIVLSVMFLSAGAFAGASHTTHRTTSITATAVEVKPENVTVVGKTSAWPLAGHVSVEPCKQRRCVEI
jgi:hypothetical protein